MSSPALGAGAKHSHESIDQYMLKCTTKLKSLRLEAMAEKDKVTRTVIANYKKHAVSEAAKPAGSGTRSIAPPNTGVTKRQSEKILSKLAKSTFRIAAKLNLT